MAFNIDPTTKQAYLQQRIAQLNAEGYAHELNLKTAEALGNPQAVEEAQQAIIIIETAISVAEQELSIS